MGKTNHQNGPMTKPQKSKKHRKIKFVDPFYNGERKQMLVTFYFISYQYPP